MPLLDFTISKTFTGKCDAMVEVTLNNYTKVKVIHFDTNRFLIFPYAFIFHIPSYTLPIVTYAKGCTI